MKRPQGKIPESVSKRWCWRRLVFLDFDEVTHTTKHKIFAEVSSSMVKGLVGPKCWKRVVRKYVPEPVYRHLIKAKE